jgi:molybdopterin converting factor small subunit
MVVRVRLFAGLGIYVPGAPSGIALDVEMVDGASVRELIASLGVPCDEVRTTFVNGRARPLDWPLQPEDEVGIFPAVGGG